MRLIDKDVLLNIFSRYYGNDKIEVDDVIEWIEEQPTIEERKTGQWINVTNDESLEEEYECSVCGYELFYSNPTKFCPNCGARMEGNT